MKKDVLDSIVSKKHGSWCSAFFLRRIHYFVDGKALCGKHDSIDPRFLHSASFFPLYKTCKACHSRLSENKESKK